VISFAFQTTLSKVFFDNSLHISTPKLNTFLFYLNQKFNFYPFHKFFLEQKTPSNATEIRKSRLGTKISFFQAKLFRKFCPRTGAGC
jgi:hypothetical protein